MNPALETLFLARQELPEKGGATLFLGAEAHPDLAAIPRLTACQPLKPLADSCGEMGVEISTVPDSGEFSTILFLPGKSKDEILAGFARAHDLLAPDGVLLVSLANTAGASRYEKELKKVTTLLSSFSKNKCRAFCVDRSKPWDAATLDAWRELARPRLIPDTDFTVEPGVFSSGHVDPGSQLLIDHLSYSVRGHVADLGAGWGFLSQAALKKLPNISRIDLFEADARALSCARKNLPAEAPAGFHWHDVTKGLPEKYDHILINPPFHTAQSRDVDLGKAFLSVAAASLKRGGSLQIVANRQLPYEAHLLELGLRPRIVIETGVYKVISA
ncbi:class I SAM-dependent methyltransferase [Luteolibacter algae]|uniref:Class I SAM-dependent methyltransferase n=1 Tax=Luteolibacter algae TaxID=454151 RepID=A0ABW5D4M8_9BACT